MPGDLCQPLKDQPYHIVKVAAQRIMIRYESGIIRNGQHALKILASKNEIHLPLPLRDFGWVDVRRLEGCKQQLYRRCIIAVGTSKQHRNLRPSISSSVLSQVA